MQLKTNFYLLIKVFNVSLHFERLVVVYHCEKGIFNDQLKAACKNCLY